jgi:hypothetical protein
MKKNSSTKRFFKTFFFVCMFGKKDLPFVNYLGENLRTGSLKYPLGMKNAIIFTMQKKPNSNKSSLEKLFFYLNE